MANNEQIKKMIHKLVLEEVQRVLPGVVKEVMAGLIMESTITEQAFAGNSNKRKALLETSYIDTSELEEYPTMRPAVAAPNKAALAARYATLMGEENMPMPAGHQMITTSRVTEHGTEVPVNPQELQPYMIDVLTRDYRDVMAALDRKKTGG